MRSKAAQLMLRLIRSVLSDRDLPSEIKHELTPDVLSALYTLSKAHDAAHLVACALDRLGMLDGEDPLLEQFQKQQTLAFFRHRQSELALKEMRECFDREGISYIPLKGAVLRRLYPAPWMRTGCDLDILVQENDLERATECLCDRLGYECDGQMFHDVSFHSPSGLHVELHFCLIDESRFATVYEILSGAWEEAVPTENGRCYSLSDAHFVLYHIAHTAKHFLIGGCGIRPFFDLWLMQNRAGYTVESHAALLEKAGMLKFAKAAEALSQVWMGEREHDELTRSMEAFVLEVGIYGTQESHTMNLLAKKGGKLRYALSRIYLPLPQLKRQYPILEKHRALAPLMQLRRWGRLLLRPRRHLKNVMTASNERIRDTAQLLSLLEL